MKIRSVLKTLVAGVAMLAGAAHAAPTVIDFDDLTIGAFPAHIDVTNQYAAQGVTFSGPGYPAIMGWGGAGLAVAQYGFTSGPNAGFVGTGAVTATFSGTVSNVSLRFLDTEVGSTLGTLEAYNALNALIGSVTLVSTFTNFVMAPGPLAVSDQVLSINLSGISYVRFFASDGDGAVVDDLTFTMAEVPEPMTAMVLGLGVLGFSALRRKAKSA